MESPIAAPPVNNERPANRDIRDTALPPTPVPPVVLASQQAPSVQPSPPPVELSRTKLDAPDPCTAPIATIEGRGRIAQPRFRAKTTAKVVALTFDDGPSAQNTPAVLHTLAHYGVPATFFVLGERVEKHPELAAAIADGGHELANHTWSHGNMRTMFKSQIRDEVCRTAQAIERAAGVRPTRFRPPFGRFADSSLPLLGGLDQDVVLWSVDAQDWGSDDPDSLARGVVQAARPGAIILLHDRDSTTARALPSIIGGLRARGFAVVPLSEL